MAENALRLVAFDDHAVAPDHPSLDLGSNGDEFTIEACFSTPVLSGPINRTLICRPQAYGLEIEGTSSGVSWVRLQVWPTPSAAPAVCTAAVQLEPGPHHVAGVLRRTPAGASLELFLDGFRLWTNVVSGIGGSDQRVLVGKSTREPAGSVWIAEVRLSDTARYSGDVYRPPSIPSAPDPQTRALWRFDEPVGASSFADHSGNGNQHTGVYGAQTDVFPAETQPGSLDRAFNPGTGARSAYSPQGIYALAVQVDGRLVVGGQFQSFDGIRQTNLARLQADGSLDTSFSPRLTGNGGLGHVKSLAVQPEGRILVGGRFEAINGVTRPALARLEPDGSLDRSFRPPEFGSSDEITGLAILPGGKLLIAGTFWINMFPDTRRDVARLNPDGTLDLTFPEVDVFGFVENLVVTPRQAILISGFFGSVNGRQRDGLARLTAAGTLDADFAPAFDGQGFRAPDSIAVQEDGRLLIAGRFEHVNGQPARGAARLHADGTTDPGFALEAGTTSVFSNGGYLDWIARQPDGKVLLSGVFTPAPGIGELLLGRFAADGTLDPDFRAVHFHRPNARVHTHVLTDDGKLVIAGEFSDINGVQRGGIARLLLSGDLPAAPRIRGVIRQPSGVVQLAATKPVSRRAVIQGADSLPAVAWTTLATNAEPSSDFTFTDNDAAGRPQRFYRLLLENP